MKVREYLEGGNVVVLALELEDIEYLTLELDSRDGFTNDLLKIQAEMKSRIAFQEWLSFKREEVFEPPTGRPLGARLIGGPLDGRIEELRGRYLVTIGYGGTYEHFYEYTFLDTREIVGVYKP